MGTILGYTAERMQAIEDEAITSAVVNGSGHLILTRHDGGTVDAGSVIGPTGPPGTSVTVCTSSTRPTGGSLFTGLFIYETDTKFVYVWDGSAWQYRSGIIICTSSTHPAAVEGVPIWETDTNKFLIYNGVRFDPPWNQPWGIVAAPFVNPSGDAATTNSTTPVDISAGGITFNALTNRVYKITGEVGTFLSDVPGDVAEVDIFDNVDGVLTITRAQAETTSRDGKPIVHYVQYTSPGSVNIKLRVHRQGGSGTIRVGHIALGVEDVGPNGAPA